MSSSPKAPAGWKCHEASARIAGTKRARILTRSTLSVLAVVFSLPFITGEGCNPCGNGKLDKGEQCDDGNNIGGDGCSADCKTETATSCGHSTVAAMQTAMTPWLGQFDALKSKMASLQFDTSTFRDVLACNEGGATTQWVGLVLSTKNGQKDGVLVLRTDAPKSFELTFYYSSGSKDVDQWMVTPSLIFLVHGTNPLVVTDINGNALPPPNGSASADVQSWQKEAMAHFFPSSR